jgi:hypothetical protein
MRSLSHPWGLLALATLAACGAADGPGPAPTTGSDPDAPPPAAPSPVSVTAPDTALLWTAGLAASASTVVGSPVPVLTALRTETLDAFERVTFELAGAGGVPGYQVEYVDRPLYDCGSGAPTYPVGDAWLQVRLEPAAAHTEEGRPTLGARDVPVVAPLLQRLYRTCDFEAIVVYVLALGSPNRFRVLTLSEPPRIVVDIQRLR